MHPPRLLALTAVAALGLTACSSGSGSTPTSGGSSAHGATGAATNVRSGGTLRFALAEDPDKLDPTFARTLVGREVFANFCQKLYDSDQNLRLRPQLAAALPTVASDRLSVTIPLRSGVQFNDGTPLDAAAVKTTLERYMTAKGSARKADLAPVKSVTVVDPTTVKIDLTKPFAPLAATLADRAGMILSPTALKKYGSEFASHPVCVGPFSFASRKPGNNIELQKSTYYYDKSKVKLDGIDFRIITDPNIRLANLRSGDIDAAERLAPTDVAQVEGNSALQLITATSIGYQGITINVGNATGIGNPPGSVATALAKSKQLRQAFGLAIDRNTLNKVVFAGRYAPDCSPLPLASPYRTDRTCPKADPQKAKQMVQASGVPMPVPVSLIIGTDPESARVGQVIQGMVKAAGFDLKLVPTEFTTALDQSDAGKFDTFAVGWSGRIDPDGNTYSFLVTGAPLNIAGLSDPRIDAALKQARTVTDEGQRAALYGKALAAQADDAGLIYLYHQKLYLGTAKKVSGLAYYDDGLPRLETAGFTS